MLFCIAMYSIYIHVYTHTHSTTFKQNDGVSDPAQRLLMPDPARVARGSRLWTPRGIIAQITPNSSPSVSSKWIPS